EPASVEARRLHAPGQHPYRRLALSRRLPGCQFQLRPLQALHPDAGARQVRRLLHGGPPGAAQHADRGAEAQPYRQQLRPADPAAGAGRGDGAYRPHRHGLDHLQRALPHRPQVRLARPYQRRQGRVEPRHHLQPRRGAEFRPGRAHGPWRALPARPRILRGRHRPLGRLGRRRADPRRGERHLLRPGPGEAAQPCGPRVQGARPAECRPSHPGLARRRPGRRLRGRPPDRRRDRRGRLRRRGDARRGPAALCRHQGTHARPRPRPGAPEAPPRLLRRSRRHGGGGAGEARPSRQPGPLRQRHRLPLHRPRHRCLDLRPGRPAAAHPRDQCQQDRPRAGHRPGRARRADGPPARPAPWRLCRPRHGRHAAHHRRRDGGLARGARRGRLQHHVPLAPRRPRRFRRPRGAGAAAPRPLPPGVRGPDPARESRPPPSPQPLLPGEL
ncbi:MAG: Nitrilotriacetate monooxygenase component A, partial [uncultured Craurococcus sp.]